ncbi:MAG: type II secretion system protein GspN [Candidatus Binatia bacterium]
MLALYVAVLFLFFLLLTFPHDLQLRRWLGTIEKQSGWKIEPEAVSFVPWEGYRLSRVRISPPGASDAWIEADRLSLRPRLLELLTGRASTFVFNARAYDGKLSGSFTSAQVTKIDADLDDLSLAEAAALRRAVDGEWDGRLSGELRIAAGAEVRTISGAARVTITGAALRGGNVSGFKVPDLAFDRGDADVSIQEGRAEIRKLTLAGKQIDVDVRGDVFLRAPITQTTLNLTLGLRPVPGASPDLENMLLLWNRNQRPASGAYALTLGGTAGRPRLR